MSKPAKQPSSPEECAIYETMLGKEFRKRNEPEDSAVYTVVNLAPEWLFGENAMSSESFVARFYIEKTNGASADGGKLSVTNSLGLAMPVKSPVTGFFVDARTFCAEYEEAK